MTTVHISTIPERQESMLKTIASLYWQTSDIYVMLNGHGYDPHIPDPAAQPETGEGGKIHKVYLNNKHGDAAKVLNLNERKGFVFLCDDDLIYPTGYTDYLISKYHQYGGIITLHGRIFRRPIVGSHRGHAKIYSCLYDVKGDHKVDIGGTGVMLINTDEFTITTDECPRKNMLDIWVARKAKIKEIPITVIEHPKDYLQYLPQSKTIWNSHRVKDELYQTEILRSFLDNTPYPEDVPMRHKRRKR